jgi:hypothetical protein
MAARVDAAKSRLPKDQYLYLKRVAKDKQGDDLTAMELCEISKWLKCLPSDIVYLEVDA